MVGSMKIVLATIAVAVCALIGLAFVGNAVAAPARSSCSDLSYLNSAVKTAKKTVAALKLGGKNRYGAALVPANQALWIVKRSAVPCDEDGNQYWLHRQYSIKYSVALVRYFEEMKQGDYDRADIYWASVEFWGDEKNDITLAW